MVSFCGIKAVAIDIIRTVYVCLCFLASHRVCKPAYLVPVPYTQPFYGYLDSVQDNPRELVPEETFIHSHLSWSPVIPYLLHPSITMHGILPDQFMCLTVFFCNICPSFLWSTSRPGTLNFILHTFLHPIIVFFSQYMPIPSQPVLPLYGDYVV